MARPGNGSGEPQGAEGSGRLVETVMHFARALRSAGLPIGPGRVLRAIEAVEAVGLSRRDDLYWALHAVFVNRHDQSPLFDQAFHVFWRNPRFLEKMMNMMLPQVETATGGEEEKALSRRLADGLYQGDAEAPRMEEDTRIEIDAALTWSQQEQLRRQDFETMSVEEMARAKRAIAGMRLPIEEVATRRFRPHPHGRRADLRATLRAGLRAGSQSIPLRWKTHRRRPPPLVVLCDISGSMSRYSRMLLHFLHAVTNDRDRVHSFLFGTRLSNVTRQLRQRDVDEALDAVSESVEDWGGGTRIGACLADFNRQWSRRVLGQGAVVLLICDGLDRDGAEGLGQEMERLQKSCRRLLWLNPLLRYDAYAPKSQGARAMMPHVDEFRPVHNLESLEALTEALGRSGGRSAAGTSLSGSLGRRQEGLSAWREAARA